VTTLPVPVHGDSLAVDSAGNLYLGEDYAAPRSRIDKVTPAGEVTTLASGLGNPKGGSHLGVAVDSLGNVYVADAINHTILKITQAGVVTLAGRAPSASEDPFQAGSYADAVGSAARFNFPNGLAVDSVGDVVVADSENAMIRKVTPDGVVTTLAGATGMFGSADGLGSAARFNFPYGVAVDRAGNAYATDSGAIRRVTPAGVVTTVAGTAGAFGSADGLGSAAQFSGWAPGIAVDSAGNLYVADSGRITKGTPIIIPPPRFAGLSTASGMLRATLSGLLAGTTVVVESSVDLRQWFPVQTNVTVGPSLPVAVAINPAARPEFLRALVK
jgi:hypothetical protein